MYVIGALSRQGALWNVAIIQTHAFYAFGKLESAEHSCFYVFMKPIKQKTHSHLECVGDVQRKWLGTVSSGVETHPWRCPNQHCYHIIQSCRAVTQISNKLGPCQPNFVLNGAMQSPNDFGCHSLGGLAQRYGGLAPTSLGHANSILFE